MENFLSTSEKAVASVTVRYEDGMYQDFTKCLLFTVNEGATDFLETVSFLPVNMCDAEVDRAVLTMSKSVEAMKKELTQLLIKKIVGDFK